MSIDNNELDEMDFDLLDNEDARRLMAGATNRRAAPWLKPGATGTGRGGSRIQEERPEPVPGGLGKSDRIQMGRDP